MEILATEATLNTFSVSIQALMVSGKQMTLAVFRQLPDASAVDETGRLADFRFWGKVRYSIKDEGSEWAVAEAGGKLHRCLIWSEEKAKRNLFQWQYDYWERATKNHNAYEIRRYEEYVAPWKADELVKVNRIPSYEKLRGMPQLFIAV